MASTAIGSGSLTVGNYFLTQGKGMVNAVDVDPGTEITIYDSNTTPTGKVLVHLVNEGTSSLSASYNRAIRAELGVIAVVTGAGAAFVYHSAA